MFILGIETSGPRCSVAFVNGETILAEYNFQRTNMHSEILGELVADGLKRTATKADQFDLIAVASGPGSFTGLRIGMAYAKGLAYALNTPILPVSNFDLLAERALPELLPVDVLIDARMNRFYHARFDKIAGFPVFERISDIETLRSTLRDAVQVVVQNNTVTEKLRTTGIKKPHIIESEYQAGILCKIAEKNFARGIRQDLTDLEPKYLQKFAGV